MFIPVYTNTITPGKGYNHDRKELSNPFNVAKMGLFDVESAGFKGSEEIMRSFS
jgi:hypothetical protein